MPTPSFILPTSVPVVDASVEALRVYDGSPAGFDVLPMSFTRASTATRTDSAGNIVSAVPYNIFTYSEQLENILWLKNNITITANADTAPNGLVVADSYLSSVTVGPHPCYQSNVLPSNTYTYSVYAKKVNSRYISLKGAGGRFIWAGVIFDLDTATVVSIQNNNIPGVTGNVSSVGGGWYRISMTATSNFNDFGLQYASSPSNTFGDYGDLVIAGSGVVDYMLWGMQAVVGTQPLPYQETVTRLALPRLDYRNADGTLSSTPRLLLEPQRTNSIRNSTMVGAVVGSPGTTPTNWIFAIGGLTGSVSAIGIENGLQYIDIKLSGTATSTSAQIRFEGLTNIAALNAQVWTNSVYLKTISSAPNSIQIGLIERTSAGGYITEAASSALSVTSTLRRFDFTRTLSGGATTAFVQPQLAFSLTNGAAYDFTIRIAAPQMELGAYATTFIPTTTAAVTRLADTCSVTGVADLIGQTEGTMFVDCVPPNGVAGRIFAITDASLNNRIAINYNTNNRIDIIVRTNNTVTNGNISASASTQLNPGVINKIAFAYKSDEFALYINGSLAGTATGVFSVTAALQQIGASEITFLGNQFIQWNQAALYTTRLSNEQLQALTTL